MAVLSIRTLRQGASWLDSHLPQLTASIGIPDTWNSGSIQSHVRSSVECFLKAYPEIARK